MRIKLFTFVCTGIAAAFLWMAMASHDGIAASLSPAQLDKIQSSKILKPASCRPFKYHCHRKWKYGRQWTYCHRCGKTIIFPH